MLMVLEEPLKATLLEIMELAFKIRKSNDLAIHVIVFNKGHYGSSLVVSADSSPAQHTYSYQPVGSVFYDYGLALERQINLNTEERPCIEDQSYKFFDCVSKWSPLADTKVYLQR